jgi:maltose alpha-D-glucosyltransferase / alpha-amylase
VQVFALSAADDIQEDPLWYKDAVVYELHVKAFYDSAGDGIGDFKGLTSKLDYLKDLGVTAIWLLPFFPSPLKDDGYDISGYFDIHPLYGVLNDFKDLLREAHERGIKVIIELVMNHTSNQHPWFKKSRLAEPGSDWRNVYVWSNTPDKYKDARIIFRDFESSNWTWDDVAKAYYWHRFYYHQPDLNYDNPLTQEMMFEVVSFWMKMGVDAMRIDAVPYLYEREGTNCENLPETHEFLKKLRGFVDSNFQNRMLLAEANQWPTDAASYFGNGDECNLAFHFPLMPRMFMAIQMEDRFPIIDILDQTPKIPDNCQWALFLRNHDELTLEMVTDEERDYMYRVYARDKESRINLGIRKRLAPLLGNDRRKIELMNVLLFTLPGTPVIYYGDEIGMGDNFYLGDRNGVRTPMQWSADLNAGFSRTNPQKLYLPVIIEPKYHYEAINVENQQNDQSSLLWWMKRMIATRKRFTAFGRGSIEFLYPSNVKIIAYLRKFEDEIILVAANLSGRTQSTDLDISQFKNYQPNDIVGGGTFPSIEESAYRMTFSPYGYYIFSLTKKEIAVASARQREIIEIRVQKRIQNLFEGKPRDKLELDVIPEYLMANRWFGGKARQIDRIRIRDIVAFDQKTPTSSQYFLIVIDVYYKEGLPDAYLLPLAYSAIDISDSLKEKKNPHAIVCKVGIEKNTPGLVFDAMHDETFRTLLLQLILSGSSARGRESELVGSGTTISPMVSTEESQRSTIVGAEQSNTSVVFGDKFILKLLRRVEEGPSPELEIGQVLTRQGFEFIPRLVGHLDYSQPGSEPAVIGILEDYVRNEGDGWSLFTGEFERFLERTSNQDPANYTSLLGTSALEASSQELPEPLLDLITVPFAEKVSLLGKRTAGFHLALLKERDAQDFTPESFGYLEQVATSQSLISHANRVFQQAQRVPNLQPDLRSEINHLFSMQHEIVSRLGAIRNVKLDIVRSRTHGDYHLGQVLFTGKDFVIIDYEGEPAKSLDDRRLRRPAIRDVAGMLRSFDYAARSFSFRQKELKKPIRPNSEAWEDVWSTTVGAMFLKSYLNEVRGTQLVPTDSAALGVILDAYLFEKSIYELGYELNNRPDWAGIPVKGILKLLGKTQPRALASRVQPAP